jgi:hypothetical protein
MKKPSSLHVGETAIVYLIAAALFTVVMVVTFIGLQGQ